MQALSLLREQVQAARFPVNHIVEIRFVEADSALLSPDHEQRSVHVTLLLPWSRGAKLVRRYFSAFESAVVGLGGRPHWAKTTYLGAEQLRRLYGDAWDRFGAARDELDPERVFASDWTERTLGQ